MRADVNDGTIPLSIGIIGHRDVPASEREGVVDSLAGILRSYRDAFPNTPIVILTALAEGADQLAVDAAVLVPGVSVVAVVPMPLDEYIKDFSTTQSRGDFLSSLERTMGLFTVSDLWEGSDPLQEDFAEGERRDLAYQRCARFISLQSHVLIAVWDGEEPKLPGGTADTVYDRLPGLEGLSLGRAANLPLGKSPETTIHLPIRRASREAPARMISGEHAPVGPQALIGGLEAYPWQSPVDDALTSTLEEINSVIITQPNRPAESSWTGRAMEASDHLAGMYQRRFRKMTASILGLSVLGLVLLSLVQNVPSEWLFAIALVVLTGMALSWWSITRFQVKQRFQQFRVIAERARVQQVWLSVGLGDSVADHFLLHQPDARWIRTILRTSWLMDLSTRTGGASLDVGGEGRRTAEAGVEWMRDQVAYFEGVGARPGALRKNRSKARRFMFLGVIGLMIAVIGIIPGVVQSMGISIGVRWVDVAGQGMWALGLGIVAAAAAYSELMAFRESSRRYAQSLSIFTDGLRKLERVHGDSEDTKARATALRVVKEVGEEALQETSSWFATSYDRRVRPV